MSLASEFTPVTSKKKRRNKNAVSHSRSHAHLLDSTRHQMQTEEGPWRAQSLKLVELAVRTALSIPTNQLQVLCLGLGSPSSSPVARVQLAFLVELCDHLGIDRDSVTLYDPVFTAEDTDLLGALRMRPLTENRDARHTIAFPTICFMPHCDLELYENLLGTNWTRTYLPNILLISNRFSDYVDSNPAHKLRVRAPHLLQLAPFLVSTDLPLPNQWPNAFNNSSIQYLPPIFKPSGMDAEFVATSASAHAASGTKARATAAANTKPNKVEPANLKDNDNTNSIGCTAAMVNNPSDWAAVLFSSPVVPEGDRTQDDGDGNGGTATTVTST